MKHLSRFWLQLLFCLMLVFFDVALNVSFSFAFGKLVSLGQVANCDTQISNHSTSYTLNDAVPLLQWVAVMFGSLIIHFVLSILSSFLQVSVAVRVSTKLRKQLSLQLHQVSPTFFSVHSKREILSRFVQDINTLESLIAHPLRSFILSLVLLVTYIVYTLVTSWPLGIGLAVLLTLSFLFLYFLSMHFANHSFAKDQATNQLCSVLTEEIDGYLVNRVYDLSSYWSSQMKSVLNQEYRNKAWYSLFLSQFLALSWIVVAAFLCTVVTISTILLVQLDWLSFDIGVSLLVLYFIVNVNISSTSASFPLLQSSAKALSRINALLYDQKHTAVHQQDKKHAEKNQSGCECVVADPIELKDVCFSYNSTPTHWNLFNVSLKFKDGERVAIVGASGSGKSTLLRLVLQMYKPMPGEVIVRKNTKMAAMFQYNHNFNMSIRENIRLGNLKASDKDVEEAAKMADFHVWVSSLPRGYDTVISNSSGLLGGGETQRLALARMLLSEAQIYLLDEVTSGLDPSTGAILFNKVMEVTAGKTVIAATHQLEQAKHFDRIVILSHGQVKEQGSHEDLLDMRGDYWHMWTKSEEKEDIKNSTYTVHRHGLTLTPSTNDLTIIPMTVTPGCFYKDNHEGKTRVITTPTTFSPLHTVIEIHNSVTDDDSTTVKHTPQNVLSLSSGGYITAKDSSSQATETHPQHVSTISIDGPLIPVTTSTPSLKPKFQNQDPESQNGTASDGEWYENREDVRSRLTLCAVSDASTPAWWRGEDDTSEQGCGHQDTNAGTVYEHEV